MNKLNPYQQYRQNAVMSAGRGELTLMLYDAAVKYIKQGVKFIENQNIEKTHHAIVRAQEIFLHLGDTLNMDYEISKNLSLLYDYLYRRLTEANVKKDGRVLAEALDLAEELRDAWAEAVRLAGPAPAASL